jgi:S-DNA-T family DNA segregation ATPase FtsK/SpoIIIE
VVSYGLTDLPDQQQQVPLVLDFATLGHLHIVGSSRSGRSQTLRTLAGVAAANYSPADVHMYCIDCGNGALLPLADFPHCGAVAQRSEPERLSRLLSRLLTEMSDRQRLLATSGSANLVELRGARPTAERPPHILVLLDRWEVFDKTFAEFDGGSLMSDVQTLLREGAAAGIHLVLAGDRSLFSTRLSGTTEDKLVLRLTERGDYSSVGINPRTLPDEIPSGRAFRAGDGAETQIALLAADASGPAQARALAAIAEEAKRRGAVLVNRPFRIDVLPDQSTLAEAFRITERHTSPLWTLAGVGGDELSGQGPDLATIPTFLVAGPPRSGRSTMLMTMVSSLLRNRIPLLLVAPSRSPLRELGEMPGVVDLVTSGRELTTARLKAELSQIDGPAVVVIDDAERVLDCEAGSNLGEIARTGAEIECGLILAGTIDGLMGGFSGWHVDARRNRQGALLSPQSLGDGELIGVKLSRGQLGNSRPGRALLHIGDGATRTIQVPKTETEAVRGTLNDAPAD